MPQSHAATMDGVYRHQRHIYDLTRKYYLLGRDHLIDNLAPGDGSVLELGCGTGRNLLRAAQRHRNARFYGLDISASMLETAAACVATSPSSDRIRLARADAAAFDLQQLFSVASVDHVFISYALSMIPPWEDAIQAGLNALRPGGTLHIVDFGQQERLPSGFRRVLHAWLSRFHVTPRAPLVAVATRLASAQNATLEWTPLYRGYAWYLTIRLPMEDAALAGAGSDR
jgi:S-adenosylmethionine-diacylgycerolhomoserine-N-methlytransferase